MIIKPSWNVFKAKFSENPQDNFEWFSYLLFCNEFNKPHGLFRYKNQSAIETDPVTVDDEVVGWQAKFYDTPLSSHKKELLESIIKAKRDYPKITNLYFYSNQEWGQAKGKKPKGLVEIEDKAKKLKIALEWKTASFFESEFVTVDNAVFSAHFFTQDNNAFDQIAEQLEHSKNILREIYTSIPFDDKSIEIDRKKYVDDLIESKQQVSIISGAGGIGKTVVIKKLFEKSGSDFPFYVFKATEFELRNINDILTNCSLNEFMDAHTHEEDKIIVIDSSEKLLDIRNQDPIQEFLSVCMKNKWKIIFTTRDNYLEDLNYLFVEKYKISPLNLSVAALDEKELVNISKKYSFSLPSDDKLLELLRTPFYLNEYLKFYKDNDELAYSDFKKQLWNNNIKRSIPAREACFLEIAFTRANEGQFFINPNCNHEILDNQLVMDGILGNETAGYFITHDIFEEWALEKIINTEYIKKTEILDFFEKIGQSLPIRRSFRNWISEQLLLEISDIKNFIEEIISNPDIQQFWKDEIIVSVLLSDYAEVFFTMFKDELLANNQERLKRITFLLRLACKEVDYDLFSTIGINNLNLFSLKVVLTKPKGNGWKSFIKFIFNEIDNISAENLNFILPILHDWNEKIKEGQTTRYSSLIALSYYENLIRNDAYFSNKEIFQIIVYGVFEVKEELKKILNEVIKNKWKRHGMPHKELSLFILTKMEGKVVSTYLPDEVINLADLFWVYTPPEKTDYMGTSSREMEHYFNLEHDILQYHPASPFQTPIYWLLKSSFKKTISFILDFTNHSVEAFANSELGKHEVFQVKVIINHNKTIKQYLCRRLWCIYRGTQVSPNLLESMHMALEKYLLDIGNDLDDETLNYWLLFLLENSKSSSITAIVTSIVLAFPEKTFDVAVVLFQTEYFFFFDTSRLHLDTNYKSQLLMLKKSFGFNQANVLYEDERIKACDEKHRKRSLENLFLEYQIYKAEEILDETAEKRQEILWNILDKYYSELSIKSDKIWRLSLAKMDKRKMNITTEEIGGGKLAVTFNPEVAPDLKEYSEQAVTTFNTQYKYIILKIWAEYKFERDKRYNDYPQYEKAPLFALNEVKELIKKLDTIAPPDSNKYLHLSEEESFYFLNSSIPAYVCSVLIRDYSGVLTKEDRSFCKAILMKIASSSLSSTYEYQISDGVPPCIMVLPNILKQFPEEIGNIKTILFISMFNESPAGGMMSNEVFNIFPRIAIEELFRESYIDANSILLGYLLLKPKYDELIKVIQKENYQQGIYESFKEQLTSRFLEENKEDLQKLIDNKLAINDATKIDTSNLPSLRTTFQLVPNETNDNNHKNIVNIIISTFAENLLSNQKGEKVDYIVRDDFLEKYAYYVLSSPEKEIPNYLKPFLDDFKSSEAVEYLFKEFISAEDRLNTHYNFWIVWNLFKPKIYDICGKIEGYNSVGEVVKSYLFAQNPWKEDAKEWHLLKDINKKFFKDISNNIGHNPATLYSISKLLYGIGNHYLVEGISWISIILNNNKLDDKKLEEDTINYLEQNVRKYILENREKIKRTKVLKDEILIILDFLTKKGSVVGYMLRENIV